MSDIKISQLTPVTSLTSEDLTVVSKKLGVSNWESNSITLGNVYKSLGSSGRNLKVANDGVRDADNIKDAVDLATALVPTQTNPVVITVFPGTYTEDNPITIPQWVTIVSTGGNYSVEINAVNDGNIFISSGNSLLNGFTINGGVAFSNVAYYSASSLTSQINNCIISNCYQGIVANGGSIITQNITGLSLVRVFDKFIRAYNDGFISASLCNVTGVITRPTCSFSSSDSGSELYLFSCNAHNVVRGISAGQNGYLDVLSCHFEDCDDAIHIGATGSSTVKAIGCIIEDSVTNDLNIESATAYLAYSGHINSSKFSIVSGATVNIVADDENTDGGLIVGQSSLQGRVSVGTPGAISLGEDIELNVGEGSSFTKDQYGNEIVEYWSYDASAASGSRFTRFANNAGTQLSNSGDAIVVGCRYQFPAIRLDVNVAAVTGAAHIILEYWNGSSWTSVGMAAYRRSDFARRGHNPFLNVETQFVEGSTLCISNGDWSDDKDVLDEIPDWDSGEDFYAIRFRNSGALTSGMQFDDGRVKPHSFMVSTSGYKANFGTYRTERIVYIDSTAFTPDPVNPPSYISLQMSPNIAYANQNSFLKANAISQISTAHVLPNDIDTSSPFQIFIDGVATTADVGNISTAIFISRLNSQSPVITLPLTDPEVEDVQITVAPGIANTLVSVVQNIDISTYNPGDVLLMSFARYGTDPSDDYPGDFIAGDITLKSKIKFV